MRDWKKLPSLECGGFFVIQIYILSGAGDGGGGGSNWNSLSTCNAHQFIRNHRGGISRRECKEMLGT